jgi:hypothetical protein
VLDIKGDLAANPARYKAHGECAVFYGPEQSKQSPRCTVTWVAEGAYDATAKSAWETITAGPRHRPLGRYTASAYCGADPWLSTSRSPICYSTNVGPNTGSKVLERHLIPFFTTVYLSKAQQQALIAEKGRLGREARAHAGTSLKETAPRTPSADLRASVKDQPSVPPRIVSPAAGSIHKPLAAVNIRVAAPKVGTANVSVKTYELEWQIKQKDGRWQSYVTHQVAAAEAEGPGFTGWGAYQPGTPGVMTATVGNWRVRAMIKDPRPPNSNITVGEFVEFTIAGTPVTAEQARLPAKYPNTVKDVPVQGVASPDAASPMAARKQLQTPAHTGIQHDAAALNPQPLPPKQPDPVVTDRTSSKPLSAPRDWNRAPSTFGK